MFYRLKIAFLLLVGSTIQLVAQNSNTTLSSAINARDWTLMESIATQLNDPAARTLATWGRLRAGRGDWVAYHRFIRENPDWPGLSKLRGVAERAIDGRTPRSEIKFLFTDYTPQTVNGALALGKIEPSAVSTAWINLNLGAERETALLANNEKALKPHHNARLQNLLWRGEVDQVKRMLPLVSSGAANAAQARLEMQSSSSSVSSENLTGGLAFDNFQNLIKREEWDAAQDAIIAITGARDKMERPAEWANRRRGFARRAMRNGDVKAAYDLARFHGLSTGSHYADLEWLAGYIALYHLKKPTRALEHFKRFDAAVQSPISRGRAAYWLGQTYEALGDYKSAAQHYEVGAKDQTSFYGQLAAQRNRAQSDPSLTGKPLGDWRNADFVNSTVFQAAQHLHAAGETVMTRWFLSHMAETLPMDQLPLLASYSTEMGADFSTISIAKQAVKRGAVIPSAYFPVTALAAFSTDVPPELAMAIARRESELNPSAASPAGARGLMQVMPATAREVAAEIGVEYNADRLGADWQYNATLGTAYLRGMIDKYDGSYVLGIAAYNAGPHRVDEWIETYGDPRKTDVDVIHWIEHIPYRETRNYVMRVIEGLHVYRMRILGAVTPLQIYDDLSR